MIDTPLKSGSSAAAPVTRMLGHVMGIPALQQVQPGESATNAMTRASNMASLVAAMLLKFKPEHRREALEAKGGLYWTQQVLGFAEAYPGALGVTDAIRFSLALHFLVGIADADARRSTVYAQAYLAFRDVLEAAQDRRGGRSEPQARVESLGGAVGWSNFSGVPVETCVVSRAGASLAGLGQTAAQSSAADAYALNKFNSEMATLQRRLSQAAAAEDDGLMEATQASITSLTAEKAARLAAWRAEYLRIYVPLMTPTVVQSVSVAPPPPPPPPPPQQVVTTAPPPPQTTVAPETGATGYVDSATPDAANNLLVRGWACVRGRTDTIDVRIYAGGPANTGSVFVGVATANQPREVDVGRACGTPTTSSRGFTFVIPAARRAELRDKSIFVHGVSDRFGGRNEALGNSGTLRVTVPQGVLDAERQALISAGKLYPAPPDAASVDLTKFSVGGCIWWGYQLTPEHKRIGITKQFTRIFGRAPNNAELNYFGSMKWCAYQEGLPANTGPGPADKAGNPTMEAVMQGIAADIRALKIPNTTPAPGVSASVQANSFEVRTATSGMERAIQQAADAALDFVGKSVGYITDILCKGLAQLLGPVVGGAICDVLKVVFNVAASTLLAATDIVLTAVKAVNAFIVNLIAGNTEKAFTELLRGIGQMLFLLSAPVMVPALMGQTKPLREGFTELKAVADRVTARNPLFPLTLILAIIGVLTAPTKEAIGAVVIAFTPMVAVFAAPELKKLPQLASTAVESIEKGIEKLVKFGVIVVQGLMDIQTLLNTLKSQLVAYFEKKLGSTEAAWKFVGDVLLRLGGFIQTLVTAINTFKFGNVTEKAVEVLKLVPELVLAILPDAKEMIPALSEWVSAAKAAGASVEAQQAKLAAGAREILKNMGAPEKFLFLTDEARALARAEAAKLVAVTIGQQYKASQAAYPQFTAELRMELLKV